MSTLCQKKVCDKARPFKMIFFIQQFYEIYSTLLQRFHNIFTTYLQHFITFTTFVSIITIELRF